MVYLLYGEDNYLKNEFVKKAKKSFGELQLGINYIQIDESNVNNVISDIETPAFGYERKMIIVKNVNILVCEIYYMELFLICLSLVLIKRKQMK